MRYLKEASQEGFELGEYGEVSQLRKEQIDVFRLVGVREFDFPAPGLQLDLLSVEVRDKVLFEIGLLDIVLPHEVQGFEDLLRS